MGLDVFDITWRVKRALGVDLSQDDLIGLVRDNDIAVGDLYDLLLQRMHLRDIGRHDLGLNFELWRQIQRMLHMVTDVPSERIELKTPLEELFPRETRRMAWDALGDACPYRLRKLDYPASVRAFGFLLAAGMVLLEQLQIWQLPAAQWVWPLLGVIGIWMFVETYLKILAICAPLRNRFPAGLTTVKELCRAVMAMNYAEICKSVEPRLGEGCPAVWHQLTDILADTLGVDSDQITFQSRLFHDLGADG
jgi:acyl carrier protein